MRLRRNWKGEAALDSLPGVIGPQSVGSPFLRDWRGIFGREAPLHVEIGMGKGDFIIAAASEQPQVDFVGIEKTPTVLYAAAAKNQGRPFGPLGNLRFLPIDAGSLEDYFFPGQIARIYLNFSDPWPKRRHESRRLTAKEKLAMYGRLLEPEGQVYLKTDGEDFFAFSLQGFVSEGWSVGKVTTDLHRSGYEGNIPTEYERRFVSMGQRIYRFEAWRHE